MNTYVKTLLSIFSMVILTIVLHYTGVLSGFESLLKQAIFPASSQLYQLSVKLPSGEKSFSSPEELLYEYKVLREHEARFMQQQAEYLELKQENKTLRKQLFFLEDNPMQTVGADIIGKQIDPISRTITINRGFADNIAPGNPVISEFGVLVGVVELVNEHDAIIRLLTDNESRVAAMIMNEQSSSGIIEGGFGITIRMTFIPQNELIEIGDVIVSSGLEDHIPRGLIIGEVASVEKEPYQPFQRAIISTPIIYDKLSVVSVIIDQHI